MATRASFSARASLGRAAPLGELRKIPKLLAGIDDELWFTSQVRTRVQVVEITDPALMQKVTAALDQPAGSSWPFARVPRLIPGKGVKLLAEGEVLALDGHPGDAQWKLSRGGEPAMVHVKSTPTVGPDGYTITSKLDWRVEESVPGGLTHEAYGWTSAFLIWDGEPVVLRAPDLAGSAAADHTFLVLSATMINSFGTQLRAELGDAEPTANTVTGAVTTEVLPLARYAWFCTGERHNAKIADALSFIADTKARLSLKYEAWTEKLLVSGQPDDFAQLDPVLAAFPPWEQQFRIAVGWAETPKARMELLAVADQDATVRLPPPAGAGNRPPVELTLRVKELAHAELYNVEYTARQKVAGPGNESTTLVAGAVRLHNGVPQPVTVGNGLLVTVDPVNSAGWRIANPFAEAVELHRRLRQERQQHFAESAKLLEACLVPEFRVDKTDLKTAVEKLAGECRRLGFPPPAGNLVFAPPAEVQIVEERTTTTKPDGGWGNDVQETKTTKTQEIVARRQKSVPQRTGDLALHGTNLAELLRQLQAAYACRIVVENNAIRVSPVPDLALRRFSVAKAILKDAGADLPGFFVGHGVAFQDTDRLLYVPELDTLLAFGSDPFLDAVARVLAAQDVALWSDPPPIPK